MYLKLNVAQQNPGGEPEGALVPEPVATASSATYLSRFCRIGRGFW
jgi:hypothetical protein